MIFLEEICIKLFFLLSFIAYILYNYNTIHNY
nr:MAG TPA: hypothetical protein [Caudoviricetes sp.]